MNIYICLAFLLILSVSVFCLTRRPKVKSKRDVFPEAHFRFDNLTSELKATVNEILNADLSGLHINAAEVQKRKVQQAKLRLATRQACLGDAGEGEYLKEYLKELLQNRLGISEMTICKAIPFNESEKMSAVEIFEYLYMIYRKIYGIHVFKHLEEDFKLTEPETDEEGRQFYCVTSEKIRNAYAKCTYEGDYVDMLETLTQRCYEVLYGHDVADILIMDSDIDGVSGGVGGRTRTEYNYMEELLGAMGNKADNSYDVIYCVYKGRLVRMKFMSFGKELTLERVVKNIYRYNTKTTLSKRNPVLNASFRNNSRIVVARPPVSDSWAFYVRKFASADAKKIESLITDTGAEKVIELLRMIVKNELNFVISGNTGGGKTTLLKALIGYINPSYALRVIESSFELNINNLYPNRNVHVMQERGDFTVYDAIAASKKMDTDVLILGEVNEPKVAGAFVQVAQSGSRMAITTLHHETTQKLIEYLRNALVSECGISDVHVAEQQVIDLISYDIHMVHDVTGHHFIERITKIERCETADIPEESNAATREFYRRMTAPETYRLTDIVTFDRKRNEYVFADEVNQILGQSEREAAV